MNIRELIKMLKKFDKNTPVFISVSFDKDMITDVSGKTITIDARLNQLQYTSDGGGKIYLGFNDRNKKAVSAIAEAMRKQEVSIIGPGHQPKTATKPEVPTTGSMVNNPNDKYRIILDTDEFRRRQLEGISKAKEDGSPFGRPNVEISEEYIKYYEQYMNKEIGAREAADLSNMPLWKFYKYGDRVKKILEEKNKEKLKVKSDARET